jgi:hypothetical protein
MDSLTLARFSFLIPFWALSISFLRVARYPHLNCNREDLGKRTKRPASGRALV